MKLWYIQDALRMSPAEVSAELNQLELRAENAETLLRERLKLVERLGDALVYAYRENQNMQCFKTSGSLATSLNCQTASLRAAVEIYRKHVPNNLTAVASKGNAPDIAISGDAGSIPAPVSNLEADAYEREQDRCDKGDFESSEKPERPPGEEIVRGNFEGASRVACHREDFDL